MFKRCTYFFLLFLLYSFTYGMHFNISSDEVSAIINSDELSDIAKNAMKALISAVTENLTEDCAKFEFARNIRGLSVTVPLVHSLDKDKWNLKLLSTSRSLQALFTIIRDHSHKGQEEILRNNLSEWVTKNYIFPHKIEEPTKAQAQKGLPHKQQTNKTKDKKKEANTSNDKEPKTLNDDKSKQPKNAKKPTISQGFPFGKVIAVTTILGAIALLYYNEYSKAKEHPTQTA